MKKEDLAVFNKILICLYIIIAFLFVNTLTIIITNGNGSKSNNSSTNSGSKNDSNSDYDTSMMKDTNVSDLLSYFKDGTTQVVYMGRATCSACVSFLPTLQKAQDDYGYTTLYLDIEKVSQSTEDFKTFISKLDKDYTMNTSDGEVTEEFGTFYGYTPAVFIIKDGKMADGIIGGVDQSTFEQFLESNGITK